MHVRIIDEAEYDAGSNTAHTAAAVAASLYTDSSAGNFGAAQLYADTDTDQFGAAELSTASAAASGCAASASIDRRQFVAAASIESAAAVFSRNSIDSTDGKDGLPDN